MSGRMTEKADVRDRLLAVLVVVAVAAALKLTQPVTLPLAAAIFIIVLAWPLQEWLERALPRGLAYGVTVLTVLVLLAAFIAATVWSLGVVLERAPDFMQRLGELRERIGGWAEERELPIADVGEDDGAVGAETIAPLVASLWRGGAILFLTVAFFVLALVEVRRFRAKLTGFFGARGEHALDSIRDVGGKVRGFLVALTIAGLLSGVASLFYGLALGLEHVLVWAFLAYLLNYIPVVGSTLAVFPPTLWALVQFDGFGRPLAVLLGFGAIQFIVGNYVAPIFEARYTRISPLVVLVSIVLWGFLWGPIGAVLGVPLTVAIVTACGHMEGTRWIAALLADSHE
jgi:AI-2 transport protein TqsA